MKVGILALQGDFREHEEMLNTMGISTQLIKLPYQLEMVDRLIIPGGESTTIGKLMSIYNLLSPIRKLAIQGMPIWGTCAGAILLAKNIEGGLSEGQPLLKIMNIIACRNAFGSQLDSFEYNLTIKGIGKDPFHIVFIRAPILKSPGKNVNILAQIGEGKIVAAQQNRILATCFHPELTNDVRLHKYFLSL